MLTTTVNRHNNFDLIRLAAAFSILLFHFATLGFIKGLPHYFIYALVQFFPGVPIFFIISGFLLTNSQLTAPGLWRYASARLLRLYPALIISTCITSVILCYSGMWNFTWFINQFSIIWLYGTPQVVVPFGGGMPNGVLWTIPIEFKFYLLLPCLMGLRRYGRRAMAIGVVALMLLSAILQLWGDFGQYHRPDLRHGILHHFWFFGFGIMARLYWHEIAGLCRYGAYWLLAHAVICAVLLPFVSQGTYRMLGTINVYDSAVWTTLALAPTLTLLVLAAAFTCPALSKKLLRGNDISYGLYLYHMPYQHVFQRWGWVNLHGFGLGLLAALATATLSWKLVEEKCLHLVKHIKPAN